MPPVRLPETSPRSVRSNLRSRKPREVRRPTDSPSVLRVESQPLKTDGSSSPVKHVQTNLSFPLNLRQNLAAVAALPKQRKATQPQSPPQSSCRRPVTNDCDHASPPLSDRFRDRSRPAQSRSPVRLRRRSALYPPLNSGSPSNSCPCPCACTACGLCVLHAEQKNARRRCDAQTPPHTSAPHVRSP